MSIVDSGSVKSAEAYEYRNLPIPGGGYITGFTFHETQKDLLYLRTDIGGSYRLHREPGAADFSGWEWESLTNHVNMNDLRETFPIAIALDPQHPEYLYIVSGCWDDRNAKLSISKDCGKTFSHVNLPFRAHGNMNGRGTGEKLIVDRNNSKLMYFASQADGFWSSGDGGKTWSKKEGLKENYLTFAAQSPDGKVLYVGTAGVTCAESDQMRGPALYYSLDGGLHFEAAPQPENYLIEELLFSGLVAHRYAWGGDLLYVTFSVMGPNAKNRELGYSCDNGSIFGGKLVCYHMDSVSGRLTAEDITPDMEHLFKNSIHDGDNPMDSGGTFGGKEKLIRERKLPMLAYGLVGISACASKKGLLVVSTVSKEDGDCLLRSLDGGSTWEVILYDLSVGVMDFRTEYMKPPYNGGHNLVHWMTDVKINPFDPNECWFNTGTGPFCTRNLLDEEVHFSDFADGVEETVHLNLYSPTKGPVKLIDIVGDLGGFAFKELDHPCDNSFADADGNRYITCINADYSDLDPSTVIVTPRGNWTGMTKGGLILSKDQCSTFERLPMPFGLSEKTDRILTNIEKPNVNSGWVCMSPDCQNIVWSLADGIFLPVDCVLVSNDGGRTFEKAHVFDFDGTDLSLGEVPEARQIMRALGYWWSGPRIPMPEHAGGLKVFSDRMDSSVFYGFGFRGEIFVSRDGGRHFHRKKICIGDRTHARTTLCESICTVNFAFIDTINKTEVRGECGKFGTFYMALKGDGLWKLTYDSETDRVTALKLSDEGDVFYRLGLGVGRPGGDYYLEDKALYVAASIGGVYGFYRTLDEGKSFTRVNTEYQMYGEINSMEGDSQEYGRFYIATGSRGVLYGQPVAAAQEY